MDQLLVQVPSRTQSRLTGAGIRALDFKLLGLKERPPLWQQQEGAFIDVRYAPGRDQIRPRTEVSRWAKRRHFF